MISLKRLVTMLLVAFEQSEGVEYLKNLLSQTLNEQVGKLEECEMDIVKIKQQKPTFTDDELNEQLTQNRLRLESSCQMIFDHIFASYDMVPRSIRKMCTFLTRTIESTGEAGEVDSAAAQFKSGMSKTISAQRHNTMLGSHAMLGSHTSASNSSLFKNANNASHLTEKAPAPNGSTELSSPPPPQQQKKRQGTRLREEIKINESAEEEDSYPNSPREGKSLSSVKPPSLNGSEGSKGKGIMGSGSSGMLKSGSKIASSTSGPNLSSANEVRTLKSQLAELKSHDMPRSVCKID